MLFVMIGYSFPPDSKLLLGLLDVLLLLDSLQNKDEHFLFFGPSLCVNSFVFYAPFVTLITTLNMRINKPFPLPLITALVCVSPHCALRMH